MINMFPMIIIIIPAVPPIIPRKVRNARARPAWLNAKAPTLTNDIVLLRKPRIASKTSKNASAKPSSPLCLPCFINIFSSFPLKSIISGGITKNNTANAAGTVIFPLI